MSNPINLNITSNRLIATQRPVLIVVTMTTLICDDVVYRIASFMAPADLMSFQTTCSRYYKKMEPLWYIHYRKSMNFAVAMDPVPGSHRQLLGQRVTAFRRHTGGTSRLGFAVALAYLGLIRLFKTVVHRPATWIFFAGSGIPILLVALFYDTNDLWRPYVLDSVVIALITVPIVRTIRHLYSRLVIVGVAFDDFCAVYMTAMLWSALTGRKEVGVISYLQCSLIAFAAQWSSDAMESVAPFVDRYRRMVARIDERRDILRDLLHSPIEVTSIY